VVCDVDFRHDGHEVFAWNGNMEEGGVNVFE
jgi:hypothetical protein